MHWQDMNGCLCCPLSCCRLSRTCALIPGAKLMAFPLAVSATALETRAELQLLVLMLPPMLTSGRSGCHSSALRTRQTQMHAGPTM